LDVDVLSVPGPPTCNDVISQLTYVHENVPQ